MISHYWSCSKFADKLRGTPKPKFFNWDLDAEDPMHDYQEWEERAKEAHPIRYWLVETFLDGLQKALYWPHNKLQDLKHLFRARFVKRWYLIDTGLDRYHYYDYDYRMLYGCFNLLKEYVESRDYDFIHEVDYLQDQRQEAKTILDLYDWWADYDSLVEAHEERLHDCLLNTEGIAEYSRIEKEFYDEQESKLIELMKVRRCLWD